MEVVITLIVLFVIGGFVIPILKALSAKQLSKIADPAVVHRGVPRALPGRYDASAFVDKKTGRFRFPKYNKGNDGYK